MRYEYAACNLGRRSPRTTGIQNKFAAKNATNSQPNRPDRLSNSRKARKNQSARKPKPQGSEIRANPKKQTMCQPISEKLASASAAEACNRPQSRAVPNPSRLRSEETPPYATYAPSQRCKATTHMRTWRNPEPQPRKNAQAPRAPESPHAIPATQQPDNSRRKQPKGKRNARSRQGRRSNKEDQTEKHQNYNARGKRIRRYQRTGYRCSAAQSASSTSLAEAAPR